MDKTFSKRVLIMTPPLTSKGGIANYYKTLKDKFTISIEYCTRGARNQNEKRFFIELYRFLSDLIRFSLLLKTGDYSLVHLNTSLSVFSVVRDALYIKIAQKYGVKTLPFFRGWSDNAVSQVDKYVFWLFKRTFLLNPVIVTLSKTSEVQLRKWGYEGVIEIETTLVDEELLRDFELEARLNKYEDSVFKILFLARVEFYKGIQELLSAFELLNNKYDGVELIVAGDGAALEYVQRKAQQNPKISIAGYVSGKEKKAVLTDAHIYVLPSYAEGLPNSILEAMALGLPVVCTGVGGIIDIVEDKKNGIIISEKDSNAIFDAIETLYNDRDLCRKISKMNYSNSSKFYASNVAKRLESIYEKILIK